MPISVKKLAIVIALVIAAALACSCGSAPDDESADDAYSVASAAIAAVSESSAPDNSSPQPENSAADTSGAVNGQPRDAAETSDDAHAPQTPSPAEAATASQASEPATETPGPADAASNASAAEESGSATGQESADSAARQTSSEPAIAPTSFSRDLIPPYSGSPDAAINNDAPFFTEADLAREPFESFSALDNLGRCGTAMAMIDKSMLPTEERGSIGDIRPSGWKTARYAWVDQEYLFNRCHLIAYQLTGQNANELNLITGTRTMNVEGMEPHETMVADYIENTGNHVLYRATPVFDGDNLVADGVLLEAQSIEDGGAGIRFCRWCYNVEPGVAIDYATGDNWSDGTISNSALGDDPAAAAAAIASAEAANPSEQNAQTAGAAECTYILNTSSHKFHHPSCPSVADMEEKNMKPFYGTRDEAIAMGYEPCGNCRP